MSPVVVLSVLIGIGIGTVVALVTDGPLTYLIAGLCGLSGGFVAREVLS